MLARALLALALACGASAEDEPWILVLSIIVALATTINTSAAIARVAIVATSFWHG